MVNPLDQLGIAPLGEDQAPLSTYHQQMLSLISVACGMTAEEQARFIGAKACVSCGAYQHADGSLPCGH